jgi:hypothetical protein
MILLMLWQFMLAQGCGVFLQLQSLWTQVQYSSPELHSFFAEGIVYTGSQSAMMMLVWNAAAAVSFIVWNTVCAILLFGLLRVFCIER